MKKSLIFAGMLVVGFANAQYDGKVGVNTETPKATLEIQPTATNLTGTTNEGLLIPRLDRERVKAMGTNPEESTLVYVESLGGTQDGTVENVDAVGFYYFVKGITNKWIKQSVEPWRVYGTEKQATLNTQNIYQKGNVVVTHKDIPTYFLDMGEESSEEESWGMKTDGRSFSTYAEQMALDGTFFGKHYGKLTGSTLSLRSRGKNNGGSIAARARIEMHVGREDSSSPYSNFYIYKYGGDQYNETSKIEGAYIISHSLK